MALVTNPDSIKKHIENCKVHLENELKSGQVTKCVSIRDDILKAMQKQDAHLQRTVNGRMYLEELQIYMHELEPRIQDMKTRHTANKLLLIGRGRLKKVISTLNSSFPTRHKDAASLWEQMQSTVAPLFEEEAYNDLHDVVAFKEQYWNVEEQLKTQKRTGGSKGKGHSRTPSKGSPASSKTKAFPISSSPVPTKTLELGGPGTSPQRGGGGGRGGGKSTGMRGTNLNDTAFGTSPSATPSRSRLGHVHDLGSALTSKGVGTPSPSKYPSRNESPNLLMSRPEDGPGPAPSFVLPSRKYGSPTPAYATGTLRTKEPRSSSSTGFNNSNGSNKHDSGSSSKHDSGSSVHSRDGDLQGMSVVGGKGSASTLPGLGATSTSDHAGGRLKAYKPPHAVKGTASAGAGNTIPFYPKAPRALTGSGGGSQSGPVPHVGGSGSSGSGTGGNTVGYNSQVPRGGTDHLGPGAGYDDVIDDTAILKGTSSHSGTSHEPSQSVIASGGDNSDAGPARVRGTGSTESMRLRVDLTVNTDMKRNVNSQHSLESHSPLSGREMSPSPREERIPSPEPARPAAVMHSNVTPRHEGGRVITPPPSPPNVTDDSDAEDGRGYTPGTPSTPDTPGSHRSMSSTMSTISWSGSRQSTPGQSELSQIRSLNDLIELEDEALAIDKDPDLDVFHGQVRVYKAKEIRHRLQETRLVVKTLDCVDQRIFDMKMYEAETFQHFATHPNVLELYSHWSIDDPAPERDPPPYARILMLFERETRSLADVRDEAPMQLIMYLRDACRALSAIHRENIIHCRIKPSNMFINRSGKCVVGLFGRCELDHARHQRYLFKEGVITRAIPRILVYWAPEMFKLRRYGPAGDMWSLGVSFYELATGQFPFDISDVVSFRESVAACDPDFSLLDDYHPALSQIVQNLIVSDPNARWDADRVLRYIHDIDMT